MDDLTIELDDWPGGLADLGETLGAAGISVDGGGVFSAKGQSIAHFLVADGARARDVLAAAGLAADSRPVLRRRLDQAKPGAIGRRLADAGVNIEVMYSDHDNCLILLVSDPDTAALPPPSGSRRASPWQATRGPSRRASGLPWSSHRDLERALSHERRSLPDAVPACALVAGWVVDGVDAV